MANVALQMRPIRPVADPAGDWVRELLRQVVTYAIIGLLTAGLMTVTYLLLRIWLPAVVANLAAQAITTLPNTEANRRLSFRDSTRPPGRTHLQGFLLFALYYGFTSSAVFLLYAITASPSRWLEIAVILLSSLIATTGRFSWLRYWSLGRLWKQ
jgi:putative flippase GtrA